MKKVEIQIPKQYLYLSDYSELLGKLPQTGKYIINKVRTGCGGTTLFLKSPDPTIIVSPRFNVLVSKRKQFPNSFLYGEDQKMRPEKKKRLLQNYLDSFKSFARLPFSSWNSDLPPKILVTIDSYKYVEEELEFRNALDKFTIVVDEFQCIQSDAEFKAQKEFEFLHNLHGGKSTCYLSATPIPDTYLEEMDDFKDIDFYYKLIWDPSTQCETNLKTIEMKKGETVSSICKGVVRSFHQKGYFERKIVDEKEVRSMEACFFINDVRVILSIVKSLVNEGTIKPDDVNVLCSSSNNRIPELKKLNVHVGELCEDKNNPKNRTFTFCTKASFEGVDFYSNSAFTYIFSDGCIDWHKHDLIIDVPQILGRQRLDTNPFRKDAKLYYRIKTKHEDVEELKRRVKGKLMVSEEWMKTYNSSSEDVKKMLVEGIRNRDPSKRYDIHYIDVVDDVQTNTGIPKINKLYMYIEIRKWELAESVYSNKQYLLDTLKTIGMEIEEEDVRKKALMEFKNDFGAIKDFPNKLRTYSEFRNDYPEFSEKLKQDCFIEREFHEYYDILGYKKLKALKFREKDVRQKYEDFMKDKVITNACRRMFQKGLLYLPSDVKKMLQEIYDTNGMKKTAKASDLKKYIKAKVTRRKDENGIRREFYEIL